MANPYAEIFKAPGSKGFCVTGFIARMPIAMISIGLMAMLRGMGSSYENAGYVAATYVLANAMITPQMSRFADRFGQTVIALSGAIIASSALCLLVWAAYQAQPLWLMMGLAALTGFMPSFGAFVRTRWSRLYSGTAKLRTAFAFESIIDEMIFMVGPIIALTLSSKFFPAAGPLVAAVFLMGGAVLFSLQSKTAPKPIKKSAQNRGSVLFMPPIAMLVSTLMAVGMIFGAAEITALAFAESLHVKEWASAPLVTYAAGSFIAGIIYGGLKTRMPLSRQLLVLIILAAITALPLLLVSNMWIFALVLFIAGAACSPTIIVAMALVEAIVPAARLTEGMSWAVTGLSVGVASGAAVSGRLIDHFGATSGFYTSIGAAFIAVLLAFFGRGLLRAKSALREIDG